MLIRTSTCSLTLKRLLLVPSTISAAAVALCPDAGGVLDPRLPRSRDGDPLFAFVGDPASLLSVSCSLLECTGGVRGCAGIEDEAETELEALKLLIRTGTAVTGFHVLPDGSLAPATPVRKTMLWSSSVMPNTCGQQGIRAIACRSSNQNLFRNLHSITKK